MAEPSSRLEQLRRRVQSDPAPFVFAQLAQEYVNAGQYDEAIACCRALLDRHPRYFNAHLVLGRALAALGRWPEAAAEFELVLAVAPDHPAALADLAGVYERLRRPADALRCLRQALDLAREDHRLEAAIDRLSAESGHDAADTGLAAPESGTASSVDFDAVLDRLGYPDQPVPPLVEALLTDPNRLLPEGLQAPARPGPDQWAALEESLRTAEKPAAHSINTAAETAIGPGPLEEAAIGPGPTDTALAELERWLAALRRERTVRDADRAG